MNSKLILPLVILLTFSCVFPGGKKTSRGEKKVTEAIDTISFISLLQSSGAGSSSASFNLGPQFSWIKSQAAWQRLGYADHFKMIPSFPDAKPVVELDFEKHDVLIFTYGDTGNDGASIRLEKITANVAADGKTMFTVQRKNADPNFAHAAVMSHPTQMVSIDKGLDSKNIEFIVNGKPGSFEVHFEN